MRATVFRNAVVTGSEFEGADLTGAVFEDVLVGAHLARVSGRVGCCLVESRHDQCVYPTPAAYV